MYRRGFGSRRGVGYGGRRGNTGAITDPYLMMMMLRAFAEVMRHPQTPVATLIVSGVNFLLFFAPPLEWGGTRDVCLQPRKILELGQLNRFLLGGLYHGDEYHIVYNMASLLTKGVQLESRLGGGRTMLLYITSYFLCNVVLLALTLVMAFVGFVGPYESMCCVGFSGVLFALKVILTYGETGTTSFMGFALPMKYIAWSELVYIHFFVPQSSFIGHLSGILAGTILCYASELTGSSLSARIQNIFRQFMGSRRRRFEGHGTARRSQPQSQTGRPSSATPETGHTPLSTEELRQARLRRFQASR